MTRMSPRIPLPATLWRPVAFWTWALIAIVALDAVPHLLVQYWFNQSLGYQSIFWTNFRMRAALFVAAGLMATLGLPAPRYAASPPGVRSS